MTGSTGKPLTESPLTPAAAQAAVADPWRALADILRASFRTGSMVRGGEFVGRVIDAAEDAGHHPDIDLRYPAVHLTLTTHSAHRLTEADVALANRISEIAAEMELEPLDPGPLRVEYAIDALDIAAIRPFWKAVFGFRDEPDHATADLSDPAGVLPGIWFQQMDAPRPQRDRVHLDVWVPHDEVHRRLQDAITAGGQLLSDEHAPSFWVLADAEGNEVCLCTWQERAESE